MKLSLVNIVRFLSIASLTEAMPSKPQKKKSRNLRTITNHSVGDNARIQHIPAKPRIVGGTEAWPGEYPYFVNWDGCGATLIHEDIILSAAHCNPICNPTVVVGAHDVNNLLGNNNDVDQRTILERVVHPNYDDYTLENDFLIMKLNRASTKTPVKLPDVDDHLPVDHDVLTVIGFGATETDYGSETLQKVDVKAVPDDLCNQQYDGEILEDVMFCAGVDGGGKDSCQGDSGGPIMDENGVQVGVVSWGNGCGEVGSPGVYSRVTGAIDWINEQICALSNNPPPSCPPDYRNGNMDDHDDSVEVQLIIALDDYPDEVGYMITSASDNSVVSNHPPGSFTCSRVHEETLNLRPGEYNLEITDLAGDGICCGFGEGRVEVHTVVPEQEDTIILAESNGRYGSNVNLNFIVPSSSSSLGQPVLAPASCDDISDRTFHVDTEVGDGNCDWLAINYDRYNYLCQFVDVAEACKTTCDTCHYFVSEE